MESRSNERLKPECRICIHEFYQRLSNFYIVKDIQMKILIIKCFRCIVNGGEDPYILKADLIPWESDGTKTQVVDKDYLQNAIREGGAIDNIVSDFLNATSSLTKGMVVPLDLNLSIAESTQPTGDGNLTEEAKLESFSSSIGGNQDDVSLSVMQEWIIAALDLCLDIASNKFSAAYLCKYGVCKGAFIFLNEYASKNFRNPKVALSVDLIWTCLECFLNYSNELFGMNSENITNFEVVDFEFTLNSTKDLLMRLVHQGYRLSDKELRNEILIILSILARFSQSLPCFIQSGLLEVLITYSTVVECGKDGWHFYSQPIAKIRNFGTIFDIDLQFKRQLWVLISDLMFSDDEDIITYVAASPFIELMLLYVEKSTLDSSHFSNSSHYVNRFHENLLPKEREPKQLSELALSFSQRPRTVDSNAGMESSQNRTNIHNNCLSFLLTLSQAQLREFQVIAIVFLAENASRCLGEFLRVDGLLRILEVIHLYWQSNIENHKSILFHSIILLNKCVNCLPNVVKPLLEYQDITKVLFDIFSGLEEEYIRSQASRLISNLCKGGGASVEQLRLFDGIHLLVSALSSYSESRRVQVGKKAGVSLGVPQVTELDDEENKPGGDLNVFIISVLDCIQNGIVGCIQNENQFAKEEGVDAILDLLEVSPFLLRLKVLRLLSDLLENKNLISFVHAWRSSHTMRSAAQLICHCWLDEEARIGCSRIEEGVLTNLFDALNKQTWPETDSFQKFPTVLDGDSLTDSTLTKNTFLTAKVIQHTEKLEPGSIPYDIRVNAMKSDTRCVISRILELLSLLDSEICFHTENEKTKGHISSELALLPSDKQVLSIAKRYTIIKNGIAWREVQDELSSNYIIPIDSDQIKLNYNIKNYFDAISVIQLEQFELRDIEARSRFDKNNDFMSKILDQKNQQIKAEWIKKKALRSLKKAQI